MVFAHVAEQGPYASAARARLSSEEHEQDPEPALRPESAADRDGTVPSKRGRGLGSGEDHHVRRRHREDPTGPDRAANAAGTNGNGEPYGSRST